MLEIKERAAGIKKSVFKGEGLSSDWKEVPNKNKGQFSVESSRIHWAADFFLFIPLLEYYDWYTNMSAAFWRCPWFRWK